MNPKRPKILLATGLSSSIGTALVAGLSSEESPWRIISTRRSPMHAEANAMGSVEWLDLDLRRPSEEVLTTLEDALADRGVEGVDGVVHLAGVVYSDRFKATTLGEWRDTMAVNLDGAMVLMKVVSHRLRAGTSVVLVGSVDAKMASDLGPAAAYGASKAGLAGLARHLAAEWGGQGVRVNVVAPGALRAGAGPQDAEAMEQVAKRCLLGRLGRADEVADVIRFLLGQASSYVTGAVIPVDGGLGLRY